MTKSRSSKVPPRPVPRRAIQVIPGLESLAWKELEERLEIAEPHRNTLKGGERNSTLIFNTTSPAKELDRLRLAEDHFLVLAEIPKIETGPDGLTQIEESLKNPESWNEAVTEWKLLRHTKMYKKVIFRIVSRADSSGGFSRHSLARHAKSVITEFKTPRWEEAETEAPIEVWLQLTERRFVAMLRLSDRNMRHRSYKTGHFPGALRPTLAAAMVMLTEPKPRDRFVDPMCGTGTIPIERALWGPAGGIAGGDLNPEALDLCRENSERFSRPPTWLHLDARNLPFGDYSMDKVAVNLPFGHTHGRPEEIPALYRNAVREIGRILRPGGIAIFLTPNKRTLRRAIEISKCLHYQKSLTLKVLGKSAFVVRAMKK